MKKRFFLCLVLVLACSTIGIAQTRGNGNNDFMTPEDYSYMKKKKDSLSVRRASYPVVLVDRLPPIDWMRVSDEDLIKFCLGKAMVCSDAKKTFYETKVLRDIRLGKLRREVEIGVAEGFINRIFDNIKKLQEERFREKPPIKPNEDASQEDIEEFIRANRAYKERDQRFLQNIRKELNRLRDNLNKNFPAEAVIQVYVRYLRNKEESVKKLWGIK